MADSKILEDDKDEWFYNSLKRYTNLYMFDLEFPVDAMAIIDDTSICVSGIQNYSKKCELLQLSVPIKLLPKHIEDGLCKDRDFKILSGGYSPDRITQIKPIPAFPNFLATIQNSVAGCTIFKLGDEEHGVIQKESYLAIDGTTSSNTLATMHNKIVVNSSKENANGQNVLYYWDLSTNDTKSAIPVQLIIPGKVSDIGVISKVKFWDENTIAFCSTKGVVAMFDVREKNSSLVIIPPVGHDTAKNIPLLYSFDCIPAINKVGHVDTNGGYVSVDRRNAKEFDTKHRRLLPELPNVNTIIGGRFNLECDPKSHDSNVKFVVTGMKQETVSVYIDKSNTEDILSVFTHDGHSKPVTHACWHTLTDKLLFSASVDSVLHAWQYID